MESKEHCRGIPPHRLYRNCNPVHFFKMVSKLQDFKTHISVVPIQPVVKESEKLTETNRDYIYPYSLDQYQTYANILYGTIKHSPRVLVNILRCMSLPQLGTIF